MVPTGVGELSFRINNQYSLSLESIVHNVKDSVRLRLSELDLSEGEEKD